jgi:predicted glycoside hydrolase/deacetylase ChbG (UPF0249 family)
VNDLLVTADDYGLHADINRAIVECVEAGVLCSLSLTPTGEALDWRAVSSLRERGVRIGLHVTLVGERWLTGRPTPPDWRALVRALATGGGPFRAALRAEIAAQFAACDAAGVRLDHVDSHQHVHVLPALWPLVREMASDRGIPRLRVPAAPSWRLARRSPAAWILHALAAHRLRRTPGALPCIGVRHSGHNSLSTLRNELRLAAGRDVEWVAHPGFTTEALRARYDWGYDWSAERALLLDPRLAETVGAAGFRLV